MSYQQLTLDERYQVQALHALGFTQVDIGRRLGRHASTISRELRRNVRVAARYDASRAQAAARRRRVAKGERSRKIRGWLKDLVEGKLRLAWSPEQISGRLRLEMGIGLSHETIYQHVIRDARAQGALRYCLRFGGYKHHRFKKSKMAEKTRLRKGWLRQRCVAANERTELGHWERDCVLGQRGGAALLTIVDRKSRYSRIRRVQNVDMEHVAPATIEALDTDVVDAVKSITNDNGSEFQGDAKLQKKMGVPIYFTDPSSPWQRGSIENLNGLIRQYVPKGANIDKLPGWTTKALEDSLNFRPRKTLGYRSPHEVHFRQRLALISNQRMHFGLEFSALR
ncbi:MAG: transposase, family [Myxococcales bacterium]|nr:transposase, family [Myxococcales bacterium]